MNGYDELAKMFKDRDNIKQIGIMVGTVTSTSPICISVGGITFSGSRLIVSKGLQDRTEEVYINGVKNTIEYRNVLNVGDKVMIQPTADRQTFLVLDKVGG